MIAEEISPTFLELVDANIVVEQNLRYISSKGNHYPIINGIPILLRHPDSYLRRLRNFLEEQLEKLKPRLEDPGDRFWAEPQYEELQARLQTALYAQALSRNLRGFGTAREKQNDDSDVQMNPRYDGESNTDVYTLIAWGHQSVLKEAPSQKFSDAGELYTALASKVKQLLPQEGIFLDVGCGVGRTVADAAQIASKGLAIGMDISFSKVSRAQRIVRENTPTVYPIALQGELVEAQIEGQSMLNTLFAVGNAMDIQLPDESVDCVVVSFVVGVVADPKCALREALRVLKVGGSLIVADPFDTSYSYERPSEYRFTPKSLGQLINDISPDAVIQDEAVSYREFWGYYKTVAYHAHLVTAIKTHK